MVTTTTTAAPMPSPRTISMPMSSMPMSEITTVSPAKATARPEVSMATDTAWRTV